MMKKILIIIILLTLLIISGCSNNKAVEDKYAKDCKDLCIKDNLVFDQITTDKIGYYCYCHKITRM
jgi:hypothetical protein